MTKMEWAKAAKHFKHKAGAKGLKMIFWYILGIFGMIKAIDTAAKAGSDMTNEDWCNTAANAEDTADNQEVVIGSVNLNE